MAYNCTNRYLRRDSGGISNTNNFTILFAYKSMAEQATGIKVLMTVRGSSTGHDIRYSTGGPYIQANFSNITTGLTRPTVGQWNWMALVSPNGTTLTAYHHINGSWETLSRAQTAFAASEIGYGSDTALTPFVGKYAFIREWNRVFSLEELTAELQSGNPVIAANLVANNPGDLNGVYAPSGLALTTSGTVTTDTDLPTLLSAENVVITGDILLPSAIFAVSQTWGTFTQAVAVDVDDDPEPAPDPGFMVVNQTLDNFTQSFTVQAQLPNPVLPIPTVTASQAGTSPVTIVGTGAAGATITLFLNNVEQSSTVIVNSSGSWNTSLTLAAGNYAVRVRQSSGSLVSGFSGDSTFTVLGEEVIVRRRVSGSVAGPRRAKRPKQNAKNGTWPTK